MRIKLVYKCSVCREENYIGTRNKTNNPEKSVVSKYCSRCNKKTEHKEKGKLH